MVYELKNYRTAEGTKTVLVGPQGRKKMPILLIDSKGVKVRKVPLSEQRYLLDPPPFKRQKSMTTIARQYRAIGSRIGITKAAKAFLTDITNAA